MTKANGRTVAQRRSDAARRRAKAPGFFGKQLALFALLACIALIANLFVVMAWMIAEADRSSWAQGSPNSITAAVANGLSPVGAQDDAGTGDAEASTESATPAEGSGNAPDADAAAQAWTLDAAMAETLDDVGAWAILIDEGGHVAWSHGAPDDIVARTFTPSDTAVFSRTGYIGDRPCFVWQKAEGEGVVVTAFPASSYVPFPIRYVEFDLLVHLPIFLLLLFLGNAAAFYIIYAVSKHRVVRSVAPAIDALDDLAHGRPAHMEAKGPLRDISESINAASAVMRRKDEARKRWVAGVSHDIRTPLAIAMGHAERLADDERLPEDARAQASQIARQAERMRDLVADLNTASRLEYDMQPIDAAPFPAAAAARAVAADFLNEQADGRFELEFRASDAASSAMPCADERLVRRAIRNLLDNAAHHNEDGCRIFIELSVEHAACEAGGLKGTPSGARSDKDGGMLAISVADDGRGVDEATCARLTREAAAFSATANLLDEPRALVPGGPMPPRAYIEAQLARSAHSDDAQAPAAMGPSHASASPNAYGGNPIRTEATEIRFRSGAIAPDGPDATAGAISPDGPDAAAATAPSPSDAPGTLQPKELVGFNDHGLGLSLVARIVAAHGGTTSFSGAVGGGFRVTMEFPLV